MAIKIGPGGGKRDFNMVLKGTRLDDKGVWYEFGFPDGPVLYLMADWEWIQLGQPDEIIVTVKLEAVGD